MPETKAIGKRIRQLREGLKLTQREMGQRIGMPNQNISNYERGFRKPDYASLQKFADFFDVTVHYLLTGEEVYHKAEEEFLHDTQLLDIHELIEKYKDRLVDNEGNPITEQDWAIMLAVLDATKKPHLQIAK